jgi:hypothetical protein
MLPEDEQRIKLCDVVVVSSSTDLDHELLDIMILCCCYLQQQARYIQNPKIKIKMIAVVTGTADQDDPLLQVVLHT